MCSQFTLAKLAGAAAARQPASCQTYNSPPSSFDVVSDKEIPAGFPQIIQNPGMKVVEKGRNTVLVCEAGGDPNPTITWIKVGWRDCTAVHCGQRGGHSQKARNNDFSYMSIFGIWSSCYRPHMTLHIFVVEFYPILM